MAQQQAPSARTALDLVCLGELLLDLFPSQLGLRLAEVPAFRPVPGGAPANVAVAAARLGARAAFIGKVGDDAFGHKLAAVLAQEQVDVGGLRFDRQAHTTLNFLAQPDANSAEMLFYRNPGADMLLQPAELDVDLLRRARALHFGSLSLAGEPIHSAALAAVHAARQAGALISFDANYRPTLWPSPERAREAILALLPQVDLLKVNEGELFLLTGRDDPAVGSMELLARGPALVVVTLGPGGSYFRSAEGSGAVPGFAVQAVDATGCGDAFVAGLLVSLLDGGDWRQSLGAAHLHRALRYGNAVGALTALRQGVIPALPYAHEVDEYLGGQGAR